LIRHFNCTTRPEHACKGRRSPWHTVFSLRGLPAVSGARVKKWITGRAAGKSRFSAVEK